MFYPIAECLLKPLVQGRYPPSLLLWLPYLALSSIEVIAAIVVLWFLLAVTLASYDAFAIFTSRVAPNHDPFIMQPNDKVNPKLHPLITSSSLFLFLQAFLPIIPISVVVLAGK